jgi:formate dehydrogenase-N alpha subunit
MTNHYIDIRNADCIMIIGSNAAENHPIAFKWVTAAKERGAKLINVDPRFTRTSSKADIYVRMRSGTDIAFIGGMIRHVLEDMRKNPQNYNIEYVTQYTNAAYVVDPGVKLPGEDGQNGVFSGWDGTTYDKSSWQYASPIDAEEKLTSTYWSDWVSKASPFPEQAWGELNDHCVLRLLWEQYKRYDTEKVSKITGVPVEELEAVYAEYARSGAKGKAGTICYAMGTTQHTHGTQNIRSYAILQLLLANMGVAGGGINALRGTSNVQGSTDMCLLSHILPGYLKVPTDGDSDTQFGDANTGYLGRVTPPNVSPPAELEGGNPVNWWQHTPKYATSLLKAWWPTIDHNVSYHYLPKVKSGENYTHIGMFEAMGDGKIEGLWIWGQNPAVAGPNSNGEREALGRLKWLVSVDIWLNETAEFWKRPGATPADIDTEVIVLPATCSYEKQGSISNSGRWAQWRYHAVEAPGEAKPDLEIMSLVMAKLKELYADASETETKLPDPITNLDWPYGEDPDADEVAREINGYALEPFTYGTRTYAAGELIDSFVHLQDDGKTASGNWLYCNQYNVWNEARDGDYSNAKVEYTKLGNTYQAINKLKKRGIVDSSLNGIGLYSDWSWCWPLNRRIIYNRASVDLDGDPWDTEHPVLRWNGSDWEGDVKDGGGGPVRGGGNLPFIMKPEGVARLWGYDLKDGPFPEVYEPWESPVVDADGNRVNLMSGTVNNPVAFVGDFMNDRGTAAEFPYVGTTYRCTEHWQTGIMTRNLPWLNELMPNMYVEMGEDLADVLNIEAGDKVIVSSARGDIEAIAVVTKRFRKIIVNGKPVHHIGVPWQWGYSGLSKGDSGNILTPHVGDANTTIPEYKTFLCDVRRA